MPHLLSGDGIPNFIVFIVSLLWLEVLLLDTVSSEWFPHCPSCLTPRAGGLSVTIICCRTGNRGTAQARPRRHAPITSTRNCRATYSSPHSAPTILRAPLCLSPDLSVRDPPITVQRIDHLLVICDPTVLMRTFLSFFLHNDHLEFRRVSDVNSEVWLV